MMHDRCPACGASECKGHDTGTYMAEVVSMHTSGVHTECLLSVCHGGGFRDGTMVTVTKRDERYEGKVAHYDPTTRVAMVTQMIDGQPVIDFALPEEMIKHVRTHG